MFTARVLCPLKKALLERSYLTTWRCHSALSLSLAGGYQGPSPVPYRGVAATPSLAGSEQEWATGSSRGGMLPGGPGRNFLIGGPGRNSLTGGPAGRNSISGNPGHSSVTGGPRGSSVTGNPGRGSVTGGPGRSSLTGGPSGSSILNRAMERGVPALALGGRGALLLPVPSVQEEEESRRSSSSGSSLS